MKFWNKLSDVMNRALETLILKIVLMTMLAVLIVVKLVIGFRAGHYVSTPVFALFACLFYFMCIMGLRHEEQKFWDRLAVCFLILAWLVDFLFVV